LSRLNARVTRSFYLAASAKLSAGNSRELPARCALSNAAMHVFGTVDPVRGDVLPAMDHSALPHRQPTMVACAHAADLAMNSHLLPLKPRTLSWSGGAVPDAIADASLLVELALHNRIFRLYGRGCLRECDGRRCSQCRHKHIFEESHGVSPSVTAVAEVSSGPLTSTETPR
jgi:hypothetical protein